MGVQVSQITSAEVGSIVDQLAALDPDRIGANTAWEFSEDYERDVLAALLTSLELTKRHRLDLKPNQFVTESHQLIYRLVAQHVGLYDQLPTKAWLVDQIRAVTEGKDGAVRLFYLGELSTVIDYHKPVVDAVDASLRDWCERQATKLHVHNLVGARTLEDQDKVIAAMSADRARIRSGGSAAAKRAGLTADAIETLPSPDWLVRRHLVSKSLVVLAGPPGSGKSYWALDLALSIATGTRLFDEFKTRRGTVAYIYSEGESGLKFRLRAWRQHQGVDAIPQSFKAYPYRYNLLDPNEAAALLAQLAEDFGGKLPDLIIVDTLARNFAGGDENSTKDMNAFVAGVDKLRSAGPAVLVVHHTGKDATRGERGSTALRGAADTVIMADRGGSGLYLSCDKMKDGTPFTSYVVTFRPYVVGTDQDGDDIESAALEYAGTAADRKDEDKVKESRKMLATLTVGTGGITEDEAASVWNVSKSTARNRLLKGAGCGLVRKVDGCSQPPTPNRYFLLAGGVEDCEPN